MDVKLNVNVSQDQKLIMTQEMKQSIKILQLTAMELKDLIETEMMENPILDMSEVSIRELIPVNRDDVQGNDVLPDERKRSKNTEKREIQWDEYFNSLENSEAQNRVFLSTDNEEYGFEYFTFQEKKLNEHLQFQLEMVRKNMTEAEFHVAQYLIDCIDDCGYLIMDMADLTKRLNMDEQCIEKLIALIQGFDPSGVGGRNLAECLQIQLQQMGFDNNDPVMCIVKNHLKDLADNRFKAIAQATGLTIEAVCDATEWIKRLEPKPGRVFACPEPVSYVIPDGSIEIINGEVIVKVNEVSAPRLRINQYYRRLLKTIDKNDETRIYLKRKMDSAAFLIKSIGQRRNTMLKVMTAIAKTQWHFFLGDSDDCRPLKLKTIAEMINMHESTVSRTIRGKYVQTPRGTLPLKFFFKRGVEQDGDDQTSDAIKRIILELIESEDKRQPLSDQKISTLLRERNIDIARRTVTKYRESLQIKTSSRRKRY